MISRGMKSKLIQYIYQLTYYRVIKELTKGRNNILDIGSGLGFLKPIAEKLNVNYFGIEPRNEAFIFQKNRYGNDGFTKGYFPTDLELKKEILNDGGEYCVINYYR